MEKKYCKLNIFFQRHTDIIQYTLYVINPYYMLYHKILYKYHQRLSENEINHNLKVKYYHSMKEK